MKYLFLCFALLYLTGNLTVKHVLWVCLSGILLWPLKKLWDWYKHCFWVGFKEGIKESIRLGRPLTPEEKTALNAKIKAEIEAEAQGAIKEFLPEESQNSSQQ